MLTEPEQFERFQRLLQCISGHEVRDMDLKFRALRRGLVSPCVSHVSARYQCHRGIPRRAAFVLKQMEDFDTREAQIYSLLSAMGRAHIAPKMLAVHECSGRQFLCLELVRPITSWPWRDHRYARRVVELLARLHVDFPVQPGCPTVAWDYEEYLGRMAGMTLEALERLPRGVPEFEPLRDRLPALRRVTQALPAMRRQLLDWPGFGRALIHGDVHPGNVMISRGKEPHVVKLFDWARARVGSPLEDVSSWLQTLAFYEPEARKRHDTLLSAYLLARCGSPAITPDVRVGYWLAGASNAVAGALWYHLQRLSEGKAPAPEAIRTAKDWLRIVRRADEYWRAGASGGRAS